MKNVEINDNKLIIDKKEVFFEKKILEVKIVNEIIVVLLAIDGSLDNVYGINQNGDLLWKIQEPNKEIIGKNRFPYVGLSERDNKLGVIDFYGRRLYIDINNGEIIGKDIVK
ncbi:hypothetical protein PGC35_07575 [Psychrobacillus sp. PGGUH221]|uniref:hypothetical protein n=1 Tax=Psychrobacillus sp. PGGUH221 TaxID=3020058 RepID=UPI0035C67759